MTLGEKHSLSSREGFDNILDHPDIKIRKGIFFLLGKKNNFGNPRLGVSIRKADYRLAVHRNFLRRSVKNSFMKVAFKLPFYDYVVIIKKSKVIEHKTNLKDSTEGIEEMWDGCIKKK